MSFFKKIVFVIFVIVSLVLGIWGYHTLKQNKKPSKDVFTMMPDSCFLYCSTQNFNDLNVKLNSQSLIFNSWAVFDEVKEFKQNLKYYDSLIYTNELIKTITENNIIHFALYNTGNTICWLTAFNLKELKQESDMVEFCENHFSKKESKIFEIGNKNYIVVEKGAVVISNSKEFIRKTHEKGNKLSGNKLFLEHLEKSGQSEMIRFYMNHHLYSRTGQNTKFKINSLLNAEESLFGVKFSPTEIILNGSYKPADDLLQQIIESQQPVNISIYEQLPFGTNWFKAIGISSSDVFKNIMISNEEQARFWKELNQKALYNAANEFYSCIDNVLVEFSSFNNQAVMVNLNDTVKCKAVIKLFSEKDTLVNHVSVYHLNRKDVIKGFFGELFNTKVNDAFILNNALYFTESESSAQEIINRILHDATLKSNDAFMTYAAENLNTFCNGVSYIVPNVNINKVKEVFNGVIDKNKTAVENLTDANLVVMKQNGILKFRMHLKYQLPSNENIPNLLWQCQLDSDIISKPYLFTNHNTQESEVLVQDKLNQLYLINSTGTILWKKRINETIRSEIYTVDLFRNKKHQLLFNTDNYLHLIDRNGKYVQGYPMKLPAQATNAISLLDYKGDQDFRILIACKNNFIYNFNLYGVRSEGYKPFKTDAPVKLPIRFVRVGESDYLITIDETGVIQAFSRKGEGRIGFKNKAVEHCKGFTVIGTNNINRTFLYYIDDKNNLINRISFSDKKEIIKVNKEFMDSYINFENINDDQTPDFILQSRNGLIALDIHGTLIYQNQKLDAEGLCNSIKNNSNQVYYVFDNTKQKILISHDNSMNVQEIKASSDPGMFNLFQDGKNYMVYSYHGKLMCNLLK